MTTSILFLCPHNAAKSVAAAAFAQTEAARVGLSISTDTAGTEPDPEMLPVVAERLLADGHDITHTPRVLDPSDLESADITINIGCDLAAFPPHATIRDWAIPNFSDDVPTAFAALESHVLDLITELHAASA